MVNSTKEEDGVDLWQDEAKCKNLDVEQFFATKDAKEAKKFCATCPVLSDCLEYAIVYDMYGVWGGMSYNERRRKYPTEYREALRDDLKDSGLYNEALKA